MADQRMFGFNFLAFFLVLFSLISVNSGGKIIHNEPTLSLSKGPPNSQLRIPSFVDSTDGSQTGNVWPFARNRRGIGDILDQAMRELDEAFKKFNEPTVGLRSMKFKKNNNKKKTKTTDEQTTRATRKGMVPEGQRKHAAPRTKDITGFPNIEHVSPKSDRARWRDPRTNELFEWDYAEGHLEKYNRRGKHLGAFDPYTGTQLKPADPSRTIEV